MLASARAARPGSIRPVPTKATMSADHVAKRCWSAGGTPRSSAMTIAGSG